MDSGDNEEMRVEPLLGSDENSGMCRGMGDRVRPPSSEGLTIGAVVKHGNLEAHIATTAG